MDSHDALSSAHGTFAGLTALVARASLASRAARASRHSLAVLAARARAGCLMAGLVALPLAISPLAAAQTTSPPPPSAQPSQAQAAGEEPAAPAAGEIPAVAETIQVTGTRVPEDVEPVPVSITVVSAEELAARGATDLPLALALVAGVTVAPGGDVGPAGSVPEIWGLREFDAFLLVVDGVPWGGAFNPALPELDLTDLDRIEVLRGPAPVLYGATSFAGVIHVLHRRAGAPGRSARLSAASHESGSAAFSTPLPPLGRLKQSLSVTGERQGFRDDRTGFDRGHLLYRAGAGGLRLDLDATLVRQDPASPHPRHGTRLTPLVPLDANHNPRDAHLDEDRLHLTAGYDRQLGGGSWSTTFAATHSERDTLRGFLTALSANAPNARGFEQDLSLDDLYLDSHLALHPRADLQLIAGFDHLYGHAEARAEDFDYFAPLDGHLAPAVGGAPRRTRFDVKDERNFSGLYLQAEWTPAPRWRFQLGARLNHTAEDREAGEEPLAGEEPGEEEDEGRDERTVTRGSGALGVSWLAWERAGGAVWAFADARSTYKPAAMDFGPEAEAEILEPETAQSYELGFKGRQLAGRLDWEVSVFQMDFENLVVAQAVDGLPVLVNAGGERFQGAELETEYRFRPALLGRLTYSRHDAKFRDFLRAFDGVPTQLRGNRLELSARDLGGAELVYAPRRGWGGALAYEWVGDRFLNQRNTALAPGYSTWSAALGYRFSTWELQLRSENLSDERPPVAESELGDAQYYRLPARSLRLTWATHL